MEESEKIKLWRKLRKYPNVVGFEAELYPKIKEGKEYPNIPSRRIYVSKKVPLSEFKFSITFLERIKRKLGRKSVFSLSDLVPSFLDGIPTDILEIGEMKAPRPVLKNPKKKYRPVVAGISACHKSSTACSSSGFFKSDKTGKVLLGLCNHCGATENRAKIGDEWLQPSPYDAGQFPKDIVAKLDHFVEIKFNGFKCPFRNFFHKIFRRFKPAPLNKVDISFGELKVNYEVETLNIPDTFKGWRDPNVGEKVQKQGRTTGYTVGKVVSLSWTGQVGYSRGAVLFTDCILIEGKGFSAGGDSSSPVFDLEGNLIGILFAGSDTYTILCKVGNVLKEGKVSLVTRGGN